MADLHGANLRGAELGEANLRDADLFKANLRRADLRGAKGLDEDRLMLAKNWELAYRDPEHAYGQPIPVPLDDE